MPYKDKKDYNKFMAEYMRRYRAERDAMAKMALKMLKGDPRLNELVYGRRLRKKKAK